MLNFFCTFPHFCPGQGKCPGWWMSTWCAFILPVISLMMLMTMMMMMVMIMMMTISMWCAFILLVGHLDDDINDDDDDNVNVVRIHHTYCHHDYLGDHDEKG